MSAPVPAPESRPDMSVVELTRRRHTCSRWNRCRSLLTGPILDRFLIRKRLEPMGDFEGQTER
eukprot:7763804-Pyramimonas_sp.AAC.1